MNALLWLVRKDLQIFFADKQGALMTVLVPVVLASLLGMLFAPRDSSTVLELLVVAEEDGPTIRAFVDALDASGHFAVEEVDADTARDRVGAGKASLALFLPAGTAASLDPAAMFNGERGAAELLYDPSDAIEANMASGLLTQVLMQQTMGALSDFKTMGDMFASLEADLEPDADLSLRAFIGAGRALSKAAPESGEADDAEGGMQPPIAFEQVAAAPSGPALGYNSYAHNFAGMLLLFLLFSAQSRATHLVREREDGTLVRLRLSATRESTILLAVGLSTAIIALLASVAVYATGIAVFGVEIRGPIAGFAGVIVAQALFVGAFALLLAGIGRTKEQIESMGSFAVLVMAFAGGAMFPSFLMPDWLKSVSVVLPTYWATNGLAAMTWRGLDLSAAVVPVAVLLGSAVLCAVIGIRRFQFRS